MPDDKKKLETLEAELTTREHGFPRHVTDELNKPLRQEFVAQRSQNGMNLSYLESWRAIDEANRIFGNGGWTRDLVALAVVQQEEKESNGKTKWYVGYTARVRIVALGTTFRDGCGFGQGIDNDLGRAHESAIKEAESDAMKRALMTFGYPLGLALYDKAQTHVEKAAPKMDAKAAYNAAIALLEPTKAWLEAMKKNYPDGATFAKQLIEAVEVGCKTTAQCEAYWLDGEVPA